MFLATPPHLNQVKEIWQSLLNFFNSVIKNPKFSFFGKMEFFFAQNEIFLAIKCDYMKNILLLEPSI
jgi:hypothetical protein